MKNIKVLLCLFFVLFSSLIYAQSGDNTKIISGKVVDSQTNEPIISASVMLLDYNYGTSTDGNGNFWFKVNDYKAGKGNKIRISLVGYKSEYVAVSGNSTNLKIKLKSEAQNLGDVVVKKQKYKRKNNPALELIGKVVENKDRNRLKSHDYYQFNKYEKVQFALNKITPEFQNKRIFKQFKFIFENIDSLNGERCLPVYLKETLYRNQYQRSPSENKEVATAHKAVALNGFDSRGVEDYIKYLYQDVDIYDNNVPLLSNQVLSPLAGTAPAFYRFYILDTLKMGNESFIKMYFAPKSKEDLLFQGNLYIAMDGSYAIRKVELTLSKQTNINWVDNVKLIQEFSKVDNAWVLNSDKISMKFGITKNGRGIVGQKSVTNYDYSFKPIPNDTLSGRKLLAADDPALKKSDDFWEKNRPTQLTKTEAGIYQTLDSIQRIKLFRRIVDVGLLLVSGYKDAGLFEIGPISTFYQYNEVEGLRLRFGGRSTDKLSKKFNIEAYGAYGFLDKEPKYYLGLTYSLSERGFQQFPVKSLRISAQQETQFPGQEMKYLMEDNFLLSIKRGATDKIFYNRTFRLDHLNEFENHFSYTVGYKYNYLRPGGDLCFNYTDYNNHTNDVPGIHVSEFNVALRYAPHESFYQGKTFRLPNYNSYPILELKYAIGNKMIGNDYNYQSLKFKLSKRVFMSVLGYSDVIFETGKIFGQVPYPLLFLPQANQSYSYQIESYNMMNFMEFAYDEYATFMIDHSFNGFFLNKIPLVNKLGLRELVTCKVLYGKLSSANDPSQNSDLFKTPVDASGTALTYSMDKVPYIEGSVGLGNVFRILRFDLVKRFTYLNNPNVPSWGLRVRFRVDF